MTRPLTLWLLIIALLFLGVGGLYGGIAMLMDPTGSSLQMTTLLPLLPVHDFVLPGLFLLIVMGWAPILLAYALLALPEWRWAAALSRWSGHHWAWTGTAALGVVLAVWLVVEGLLIGFRWPIQYVTAFDGLVAILPSLKKRGTFPLVTTTWERYSVRWPGGSERLFVHGRSKAPQNNSLERTEDRRSAQCRSATRST